jgi:hypothetical protein
LGFSRHPPMPEPDPHLRADLEPGLPVGLAFPGDDFDVAALVFRAIPLL